MGPPDLREGIAASRCGAKGDSTARSAGGCRAFYERRVVRRVGLKPYECSAGGACAKTCALRKSGLTHVDVSSALAAKRTSTRGGLITGG